MDFSVYVTDNVYFLADVEADEISFLKGQSPTTIDFARDSLHLDLGGIFRAQDLVEFEIKGYRFKILLYNLQAIFDHLSKAQTLTECDKDAIFTPIYPLYIVIMSGEMWLEVMKKLVEISKEQEDRIMSSRLDLEDFWQGAEESGLWKRQGVIRESDQRI